MTTAPATTTLLQITAGGCAYLVYPHAVDWMRAYDAAHPPTHDARGQRIHYIDLAMLINNTQALSDAGHVLGVRLRRHSVALIVERVEDLAEVELHPLAPLIANRLAQRWVIGVAVCADHPVIVLDLEQLAADVS